MNEEKNIEKYLSDIRHDLRGELMVIREGVSQVLDGLGDKDCNKCFDILKAVIRSADKLNKKISDLYNLSKFKPAPINQVKDTPTKEELEAAKGRLVSMISHKVRTPLTIIKEGVSLVLDEVPGELNAEQKKFLYSAKENIEGLGGVVEEILQAPWDKIVKSYNDSFTGEAKSQG